MIGIVRIHPACSPPTTVCQQGRCLKPGIPCKKNIKESTLGKPEYRAIIWTPNSPPRSPSTLTQWRRQQIARAEPGKRNLCSKIYSLKWFLKEMWPSQLIGPGRSVARLSPNKGECGVLGVRFSRPTRPQPPGIRPRRSRVANHGKHVGCLSHNREV